MKVGHEIDNDRLRQAACMIPVLVVVGVLGLPSLLYPLHADQATFAYIGDLWLHGGVPYRDAWDIKGPGVFAIYAVAQLAFGRSMMSAHLVDLIATVVAAAGLYALARKAGSPQAAPFAAAVFGLAYYTGFGYQETAQVESFAAPVAVGFVYGIWRCRESNRSRCWLLAGLCIGVLMLLKVVFVLLAPLYVIALSGPIGKGRKRGRSLCLLWSLLGGAIPFALTFAYFFLKGAAGELPRLLAAQQAYARPDDLRAVATWSASQTAQFVRQRPFLIWLAVFALGTLKLPVSGALRRLRRDLDEPPGEMDRHPLRERLDPAGADRAAVRAIWLWLGLTVVIVGLQWRCYAYHFLVVLPPLALLSGIGIARMLAAGSSLAAGATRLAGVIVLLLALLDPVAHLATNFGVACRVWSGQLPQERYWDLVNAPGWYPFSNSANVADYLRGHTRPADTILVYDFDPVIYYLAQRRSPTRHLSAAPIFAVANIPVAMRRAWLEEQTREVRARPPAYLVVPSGFRNALLPVPIRFDRADAQGHATYAGDEYLYETRFTRDMVYRRLSPR